MASSRPAGSAIVTGIAVVALGLAGVWLGGPPPPEPASAPPAAFSAERAMAHVEQIAQHPHVTGSAELARVRDYLVTSLERLGVRPEVQRATVVPSRGRLRVGRVENVLARIPGTASTGAVLLATHYDSVPAAPGAADAGSAVAALLEAVRAIGTGEPLRNDLVILFTDGEEMGLLGAAAFVEQHPWARDVRAVLNFEARGTRGPAQMFETASANGALVELWAESVPRPTGSSLTYEVYKRMPNDTDFSIFKGLDAVGLNFAFVGGWEDYHTTNDNVEALDRGSLQHHGAAAVALAQRLGAADLAAMRAGDAVYFSLPIAYRVIRYPAWWALPMSLVLVALAVWAIVRAHRRTRAHAGGVILALLAFALLSAGAGVVGWRFPGVLTWLHTEWLPPGDTVRSAPYAWLLVALVVTVWCACYAALRRAFAAHSLLLGPALLWSAAAVAAAWFVPGGSYVLLWPALGSLLAGFLLPGTGPRAGQAGIVRAMAIVVLTAPVALLLWPLAAALVDTMGLAPESGAAIALVTTFALASLAAPIEIVAEGRRFWPAGAALLAALVCAGAGIAATPYSAAYPQTVNMEYVLDADAGTARWAARMKKPDAWAEQYLGSDPSIGRPTALVPPWSRVEGVPGYLKAEAPVLELPAPSASLVSSATVSDGQGRTLSFHVRPAADGHMLSVWTNGATVLDAALGGKPLKVSTAPRAADDTAWSIDFVNAPAGGATITLTVKGRDRLTVALLDRTAGLPAIAGRTFTPRPASVVPIQSGDTTAVRRTYTY